MYKNLLTGHKPFPLTPAVMKPMKASLIERAVFAYWDGAVRQLIAAEPEVLD
jgi:hypothetical protein